MSLCLSSLCDLCVCVPQIKDLELVKGDDCRPAGHGWVEFVTRDMLIQALQMKDLVRTWLIIAGRVVCRQIISHRIQVFTGRILILGLAHK